MKQIIILIIISFVHLTSFAQTIGTTISEEQKVDSLLNLMTINEKIGQLVEFVLMNRVTDEMIKRGEVGSLLGIKDAHEVNRIQKIAVEQSRLGIPIIFSNDVIHGYETTFPIPLAQAATWNPEIVKDCSRIAAYEAAAEGTHWTFAPMVDIARDPRWGRIAEGYGEDPYLVSVMAAAAVKGFQGENIKSKFSIAACAKHFAAYGAAEAGRDYNTVDISQRTLREVYFPSFKSAVDEGVVSIMSSFNELSGIPASANHFTLTEILRNEWRFDGIVISDYNAVGELVNHGFAKNKSEAAKKGINAGVDIDMVGDGEIGNIYLPNLKNLVENNEINISIVNRSVKRILRTKYRIGLFDFPYVDTTYYINNSISKTEKDSIGLKAAKESIVLLKNGNDILPLNKNTSTIALIGPLADNKHDPLGPWTCKPNSENVVTLLEGLSKYLHQNVQINYIQGCDVEKVDDSGFNSAVETVKNSDVAIIAVGETWSMSGEAASKTNLFLPGIQLELLKELRKTNTPLIIVIMSGRPLILDWISENADAVLQAWFLGEQTGNALAEVILGNYNPSGKLPVTFPRSIGQIPIYYAHKSTGRPPKEDDKFTSKYLDSPVTPLYPFGYGLSYTKFEYKNLTLNKYSYHKTENIRAKVEVTNVGNFNGEEVVQLYINDKYASVTRPVKELKGFQKIFLMKGETKALEFVITPEMLSFYDIGMKKIVEPGEFAVMIGRNSNDLHSIPFKIVD